MSSLRGRFDPSLGIRSPWNLRGFGAVNEAPVAVGATLSIAENEGASALGTVSASDADGDTLTYSITAGNSGGEFAINSSTGALSTTGALNFETTPQYVLTVQVSDSVLTDTATITVDVTNVNEAPVAVDNTFSINENAAITSLGTIAASDVDAGTTLTYSITAGDTGTDFSINASTGELSTTGALNHETNPQYELTITVSDSALTDTATVTVTVNDVNEAPVAVDNAFTIAENAGASSLGTVAATDVDGDTLTWSITAGNGSSLFTINAANGALSTTGDLDYETAAQHVLTITVTDDGTGTLSDTATVTVTVTDVSEVSTIAIPVKEHLFTGATTNATALSMGADDFGTFDGEKWALFFRFTFVRNGFTYLVNYYDYYDAAAVKTSFNIRAWSTAQLAVWVRSQSAGVYANMYGTFDHQDDTTYLLYLIFDTADGGSAPGGNDVEMYYGVGDSALALDQSIADVGFDAVDVPTASSVDFVIGANYNLSTGTEINIHQMAMYSGGYPGLTEVGTADTPVALPDTNMKFHLNPDSSVVADHILSTDWTNNNTVTTDDH